MAFQEEGARRFKQVDVFSAVPCYGNPVAVVIGADGLSDEAMQRLAHWTNLSETTFILEDPEADYHLRIFTPDRELPFAGHPTIGSAHAALEAGLVDGSKPFRMLCGLGLLTLRTEGEKIWVQVPRPKLVRVDMDEEMLAEALSGLKVLQPLVLDTGPVWMTARTNTVEDLDQVEIDRPKLIELSRRTANSVGLILYAFNLENGIDVRAFAPAVGVDEDPVCGSGNISAAGHLKETGNLSLVGASYTARQGRHIGRDGRLDMMVGDDRFELGGEAVTVIDGRIRL